jgi:hypothetical protein
MTAPRQGDPAARGLPALGRAQVLDLRETRVDAALNGSRQRGLDRSVDPQRGARQVRGQLTFPGLALASGSSRASASRKSFRA